MSENDKERIILAGRALFDAMMDALCNGGTEVDDGHIPDRIDAALEQWARVDPGAKGYGYLNQ